MVARSYRTLLPTANARADPADGRDRTARTAGADAAEPAKYACGGGRPDGHESRRRAAPKKRFVGRYTVGRRPAPLRTAPACAFRVLQVGVRTTLEWIRVAPMSLNGSQRRDQRRRLVVSWNRSSRGDSATSVSDARPMAAYGPEAHPEKQRGPATLLPTGAGGLAGAAVVMLVPVVAALALAAAGPVFGRPVFQLEGRFARSMQAASACFDPRSMQSLAGWLSQVALGVAAAVALIVRLMRRHRRDDYNGRYRAWGWLAGLFVISSCAAAVPLGPLVAAVVTDATGVALGPGGIGWWVCLATVAYGLVALWTVLPLHERGATAFWLGLALMSWATSAGCVWLGGGRDLWTIAGHAVWALGATFAAVAMLAAARSVIREVRGQCVPQTPKADRRKSERPAATPVAEEFVADEEPDFTAIASDAAGDEEAGSADDSEQEHRHLSKAERKRLKKLARMNRTAA